MSETYTQTHTHRHTYRGSIQKKTKTKTKTKQNKNNNNLTPVCTASATIEHTNKVSFSGYLKILDKNSRFVIIYAINYIKHQLTELLNL